MAESRKKYARESKEQAVRMLEEGEKTGHQIEQELEARCRKKVGYAWLLPLKIPLQKERPSSGGNDKRLDELGLAGSLLTGDENHPVTRHQENSGCNPYGRRWQNRVLQLTPCRQLIDIGSERIVPSVQEKESDWLEVAGIQA